MAAIPVMAVLSLVNAAFAYEYHRADTAQRLVLQAGSAPAATHSRESSCRTVFVVTLAGSNRTVLRSHLEYAEILLRSAMETHRHSCAAVISNEKGLLHSFAVASGWHLEEHTFDIDMEAFSYDRFRAYREFLESESHRQQPRNVVFCDADMIFIHGMDEVWQRAEFDIAMTFRASFQRINTGIMIFHRDRLSRGSAILHEMLQIYAALIPGRNLKRILGDQVAASNWVARSLDPWDPTHNTSSVISVGDFEGQSLSLFVGALLWRCPGWVALSMCRHVTVTFLVAIRADLCLHRPRSAAAAGRCV